MQSLLFVTLTVSLLSPGVGPQSGSPLDEADLRILGASSRDLATDASAAGDLNGDGIDDLVAGAANATGGGRAYVIFGGPGQLGDIDLAGSFPGVTFHAEAEGARLGNAVAGGLDFNGDGRSDIVLAAEGSLGRGMVYVVFGSPEWPETIDLSGLGARGVKILGEADSLFGHSVSAAGDFNNDGFDDLIIGAIQGLTVPASEGDGKAAAAERVRAGTAFLIYGGPGLPETIDVTALGGRGTVINGIRDHDQLGESVSGAGDFNDDGTDDVIVGANLASPRGRFCAGEAYIVFGRTSPPPVIALDSLGEGGVVIQGAKEKDTAGTSVSAAGDFNRDGVSDILVGAENACPGGRYLAGEAYLVYGQASPPSTVDVARPEVPVTSFLGVGAGGLLGRSVRGIGDVNHDGMDDVLLGAVKQNVGGLSKAGQCYLVYGTTDPSSSYELALLGDRGLVFSGSNPGDCAGQRVAGSGDINSDGAPDIVICSLKASPLAREEAGIYSVVFSSAVPSPEGLLCEVDASEPSVSLTWTNPVAYEAIVVTRDGVAIATLDGSAESHVDVEPVMGGSTYRVRGEIGGTSSPAASCDASFGVEPPFDLACRTMGGEVHLDWTHRHPEPVDGTRILRDGELLVEVPGEVRTFTDTDATPGSHRYSVTAFLGGEESPAVECTVAVPSPPADLQCLAKGCDVELSWAPDPSYTAVRVFRDSDVTPLVTLAGDGSSTFTDLEVSAGVHIYELEALVGEDSSARSVCEVTVVAPVTGLTGFATGDTVTLRWDAPEGADSIRVIREEAVLAELPGDSTEFMESGLAAGLYRYEVLSVREGSTGKPARVDVEVLASAEAFLACADGTAVTLTWSATGFQDVWELSRDDNVVVELPGASESFIDEAPQPGPHVYSLVARSGESRGVSARASVTIPFPPTELAAVLTGETLIVSWVNEDTYDRIEVRINDVEQPSLPGDRTRATYPAPDLGEARIELRGVVMTQFCDQVSPAARISTSRVGGPAELVCESTGLTVRLTWVLGGDYDSVRVERAGAELAVLSGNATTATDVVPLPGIYTYRVTGVIDGIDTLPSGCTVNVPPAVVGLRCRFDGGRVVLEWEALEGDFDTVVRRNGEDLVILPPGASSAVDEAPLDGPAEYEVLRRGDRTTSEVQSCTVQPIAPPPEVSCVAVATTVELGWPVDEGDDGRLVVLRDGELVSPESGVPVAAGGFSDVEVPFGTSCYVVRRLGDGGGLGEPSAQCCVPVIRPPSEPRCRAIDGVATLDWINGEAYDSIVVRRDTVVLAELPGDTTTFTDPESPLEPGLGYLYEILGRVGTSESAAVACDVFVPGQVESLTCRQVGASVLLTWELSEPVDRVEMRRNGELIATLDDSVFDYVDEGLTPDVYSYELRNGIGDSLGLPVECAVAMIDPPFNLACRVIDVSISAVWALGSTYEVIEARLLRDGVVVEERTLAGDSTETGFADLDRGEYVIELAGVRGDDVSATATCSAKILGETRFIRGEVTNDSRRNIIDAIAILTWMFRGQNRPTCLDAADVNDNGRLEPADALILLRWQFLNGTPPAPPFPECGEDGPGEDTLDCESFPQDICP